MCEVQSCQSQRDGSSRELWTILLGRSALRELNQIEAELSKHWQRLLEGLSYYKPPSPNSAEKVKANKDVASPLKELGLRISKFLGLDEEQSVQLLQCYLQEDYRGTRGSLKIADYYYEERTCILRCVLHLLTYFQDERHPYRVEYADCVDKLEKELVTKYRQQFEELYKTEGPTWETHGNLMPREPSGAQPSPGPGPSGSRHEAATPSAVHWPRRHDLTGAKAPEA
ncbi:nucleoporin NUP188-like isoform X2 [Equus asinus]|uniref:nucleoporin NUP188-like isoform X2 n=1 Tax=Equus asinus TaxID=9793 RepID=UPI0038F60B34